MRPWKVIAFGSGDAPSDGRSPYATRLDGRVFGHYPQSLPQHVHGAAEGDVFLAHDQRDHVATAAAGQAVPVILRGRDAEARRLVVVERAAAHEVVALATANLQAARLAARCLTYKARRNSIKPLSSRRASAISLLPAPRNWPALWPSSPDRPPHRRSSWSATRGPARRGWC